MRLLNTTEQQTYLIDWKSEISDYFTEKLSTMYSKDVIESLLNLVHTQVETYSSKLDFVISLDDHYYELTEQIQLNPLDLRNDILPHSNFKDPFLKKIFESKDWAECIRSAEPEEDCCQLIQMNNNEISLSLHEFIDFNSILDRCLSKYFSGDLKETVKKQLLALFPFQNNSLATVRFINGKTYSLFKSDQILDIKEVTLKFDDLSKVVKRAFHNLDIPIINSVIIRLWNILVFNYDLPYPVKITKISSASSYQDSLLEGIWYAPTGTQYECFHFHGYASLSYRWYAKVEKDANYNELRKHTSSKSKSGLLLRDPLDFDHTDDLPAYVLKAQKSRASHGIQFLDLDDYYGTPY